MYINEIVLYAQPHSHQRSYHLDSLRATGVISAYWAQSLWCGGPGIAEKPLPSL